jgi:hypothetical protein
VSEDFAGERSPDLLHDRAPGGGNELAAQVGEADAIAGHGIRCAGLLFLGGNQARGVSSIHLRFGDHVRQDNVAAGAAPK